MTTAHARSCWDQPTSRSFQACFAYLASVSAPTSQHEFNYTILDTDTPAPYMANVGEYIQIRARIISSSPPEKGRIAVMPLVGNDQRFFTFSSYNGAQQNTVKSQLLTLKSGEIYDLPGVTFSISPAQCKNIGCNAASSSATLGQSSWLLIYVEDEFGNRISDFHEVLTFLDIP